MVKWFILLILAACTTKSWSQQCCCKEAFAILREQVKETYSGYELKLSESAREHQLLVNALEKKTKGIPSFSIRCFEILDEYFAFFQDAHLGLTAQIPNNISEDSLNLYYSGIDRMPIPPDSFSSIINRPGNDPVIGIWKGLDGDGARYQYKIAILPVKNKINHFTAYMLASAYRFRQPSFKMMDIEKVNNHYSVLYYYPKNLKQTFRFRLNRQKNAFRFDDRIWVKLDARGSLPDSAVFKQLMLEPKTMFRPLSSRTNYLRMPSFLKMWDTIRAIIANNLPEIISKEYLVIDIRNNGGGSASGFQQLLDYLADTLPKRVKLDYLTKSSAETIKGFEKFWRDINNESDDNPNRLKILKDSIGKIFYWQTERQLQVKIWQDTVTNTELPNKIKKVIVLQDRGVKSAAEMCVNMFSASPKVYFMGTHTAGAIDKVGIMNWGGKIHELYLYTYPSAIRIGAKENPIDNIGFPPDIEFDDPDIDWVQHAQYLLENNLLPAVPKRLLQKSSKN